MMRRSCVTICRGNRDAPAAGWSDFREAVLWNRAPAGQSVTSSDQSRVARAERARVHGGAAEEVVRGGRRIVGSFCSRRPVGDVSSLLSFLEARRFPTAKRLHRADSIGPDHRSRVQRQPMKARAGLFIPILFAAVAFAQPSGKPQFGAWGFDTEGADFKTKPGDDFFRYANGT